MSWDSTDAQISYTHNTAESSIQTDTLSVTDWPDVGNPTEPFYFHFTYSLPSFLKIGGLPYYGVTYLNPEKNEYVLEVTESSFFKAHIFIDMDDYFISKIVFDYQWKPFLTTKPWIKKRKRSPYRWNGVVFFQKKNGVSELKNISFKSESILFLYDWEKSTQSVLSEQFRVQRL